MNARKASFLRRENVEHIIRAMSGISGETTFVLIGTGAVIAQLRTVPLALMTTRELDVYAPHADDPDRVSDLIDGSIGEGSSFDETFGYYAHGIGPATATLPKGWEARAKEITWASAPGVTCICPAVDDIALSKICAWREKDVTWLRAAFQVGVLDLASIRNRVADLAGSDLPAPNELSRRIDVLAAGAP